MVAGMADDKKEADQPAFVICQPKASDGTKWSFRPTRKHVIIAIVTVVIVALIITGALVGMRLYYEGEAEVFKYKMKIDDETEEDVVTQGSVVQYHTKSHDTENWFIHDFDKGIQISKVKTGDKEACFLTALNKSNSVEPRLITSTPPKMDENNPEIRLIWQVSNTTVEDVSFLGERVKKLCDKVPTHWMLPSCEAAETGKGEENQQDDSDDSNVNHNDTLPMKNREKRWAVNMRQCGRCGQWRFWPWPTRYHYFDCYCGCCHRICGRFMWRSCIRVNVGGRTFVNFYMWEEVSGGIGTCWTTRRHEGGCRSRVHKKVFQP